MANVTNDSDSILLNQIVNQGVNIYGSREKIRSALIEYAKNYLNLQDSDIKKTSYLAYLIDQISILSANHIFYDSTIYKEFFFTEAQFNESVINLAKWIGYSIPKAVPSQVDVMFSIPLNFTRQRVTFNISPYFYVRTGDNIPFIIKSQSLDSSNAGSMNIDTTKLGSNIKGTILNSNVISLRDADGSYRPIFISEDQTKAYFTLPFEQKEIILRTYEIPNNLATNQFYTIDIEFDGQVSDIDVYIISPSYNQKLVTSGSSIDSINDASTFNPNEEIYDTAGCICSWTKLEESVNGIYTMSGNSNQFSWIGGYNKGKLMFGNGILGKQPPPNSIVCARLHVTKGSKGNIVAKTISYGDPIYSDYSSTVVGNSNSNSGKNGESIKYNVMNPSSAHGGSDLLTLPEIKQNAISNLSAKNRLVSDEDYDNIETIMGNDLPINDCYAILKRSDIKVNEIMAFTTLNYTNNDVLEIVPTRNARLKLKNLIFDPDSGQYSLMRNTVINSDNSNVGDDSYYTMYNLTLDKNNLTAYYDYVLQNVNGSTVKMYSRFKDNYYEQFTYMTGNGANFSINTNRKAILSNNYNLDITFNVTHNAEKNDGIDEDYMTASQYFEWKVDRFQCKMVTKWDNNDVYDCTAAYGYRYSKDEETGKYESFGWTIDNYLNVPDGIQRFEFQLQCYAPYRDADGNILATDGSIAIREGETLSDVEDEGRENKILKMTWNNIRTYYTDIIIRRNMNDYMSSSISFEQSEEKISVDRKIISRTTSRNIYDSNGSLVFLKDHLLTEDDYFTLYVKQISVIWVYDGNTWCYVHNVPVVLKSYYDEVIQSSTNTGASNFELTVMQNLISKVSFTNRKMLTDFINIKFSDTYGPMYNLKYNTPEYFIESRYDNTPWWNSETQEKPSDIIVNEDYEKPAANKSGIYYIVNNVIPFDEGIKKTRFLNDYIGYIALRIVNGDDQSGFTYTYQLIEPTRGMYVKIKDELDVEGYNKTLVWTGRAWKDISDYNIPIEIKIKVEVNENIVSKSDDTIRKEIIDALTSYFADKIGIQKDIDRSEIIKVCRSITGITYAEIITPEFDIRFDYTIKDLTQKQLIDFTPEYIGFRGKNSNESEYSRSSIDVEIVRI